MNLIVGLFVLVGAAAVASTLYGDQVRALGHWMMDHWGLMGILLLVVVLLAVVQLLGGAAAVGRRQLRA